MIGLLLLLQALPREIPVAGGKIAVDVPAGLHAVEWVDPRSGAAEGQAHLLGGTRRTLAAPDARDWILRLEKLGDRPPATGPFTWKVPEDGGTPRDPARVVALGEREFLLLAGAEERPAFLRHAVSRLDLTLVNAAAEELEVTLRLDLSGDASREKIDADGRGFGGMPRRDFLYIQTPGRAWRRVDGSVKGWVCTARFPAPPGETRIGLSPAYPYGDYLRYVRSLPEHPHLAKRVAGESDGGRPVWELTIADPSAVNPRRIFWHTREHAYETFGSFAIEGLVAWLLSEEAADYRKRFAVTLHPMTNVDGVALGYEYRGGYDHPKPRESKVAKLTWEAVDRLRPHAVVAWHNWIAPRDLDVVFYTDPEGRRAWDLFTQRFPSPRSVGHRWSDPLKHNYDGRKLSEDNVHQYAMRTYGSQVWGWEMPWWKRDEGDPAENARRHGADFGRAFFATQLGPPLKVEKKDLEGTLGRPVELTVRGLVHAPGRAAVVGELVSPSGKAREVEALAQPDGSWLWCFTPDEAGVWNYRLRGEGVEVFTRGRLLVK